jgi:hypothetical protein
MNDIFDEIFDKIMKAPFADKFTSEKYAQKFYAALCNNDLLENSNPYHSFGLSWRSSGGFVADIRNSLTGSGEDYLDWYCSGMVVDGATPEGEIDDEVAEDMRSIGYEFKPLEG